MVVAAQRFVIRNFRDQLRVQGHWTLLYSTSRFLNYEDVFRVFRIMCPVEWDMEQRSIVYHTFIGSHLKSALSEGMHCASSAFT